MTERTYDFHPLANQYPLLFGDAYEDLVEDIKANGLIEPIVLYEGMILDGRNRHRACLDADVKPRFTEYKGDCPEIFVVSKNEFRRHLSPGQLDEIRARRRAKAVELRQQGKSYRAIGDELGVSRQQAYRDVQQVSPDVTPDAVTGSDGKSYPARANGNGQMAAYEREYNRPVYDGGEGDTSWLDDDEYGPAASDNRVTRTLTMSESNEWYTPQEYVEAARRVMGGIDTDPASNDTAQGWIQAGIYYTKDDDGLAQEWQGRVWLNPPYGGLSGRFVAKLFKEIAAGHVTEAVVLVNANSTETKWFAPLWHHTLCFTNHRINFHSPAGSTNGSTHGSVFVYIGPNDRAFYREFARYGYIVRMVQYDDQES